MSRKVESRQGTQDEALMTWVQSSLPRALAYAQSLLRDVHLAEDIVHDCYCRLLQRRERYDLPQDGFRLLIKSITNAAIDLSRKPLVGSLERGVSDREYGGREPSDHRNSSPPEMALHRELEQVIADSLLRLSIDQRAALEMKSLGCTQAEIASALDVTEGHAGVLIHRARAAVSKALQIYFTVD